jgi:enediyne biosynthesis protein E5
MGKGTRHFFNRSNLGISLTPVLFPRVGIGPPYHFTEKLVGVGDWVLPGVIICTGSFLNWRFTKRLPLTAASLSCFVAQALLRHWLSARASSRRRWQ